jgi:hypothetical protein
MDAAGDRGLWVEWTEQRSPGNLRGMIGAS